MKTLEMFATLEAFADLAAPERIDELRKFANLFKDGKAETVAARVKRIQNRVDLAPAPRTYPASLRKSLAAIDAGLEASGAKKQADDIKVILGIFEGSSTGTVDGFIEWICVALAPPQTTKAPIGRKAAAPRQKSEPSVDEALARRLADELTRTVLDPDAFSKVVDQLNDKKLVSTPTLVATANRFLGNQKSYKGRKPVLDDIMRRHKEDIQFEMTERALSKIGV